MRDTGQMINNMVKEQRVGVNKEVHKQLISETFIKEKRMAKVVSNGKMDHIMREILWMDTLWAMADIILLIWISITKVSSEQATWKEEEQKLGLMEEGMKEILKMGKRMEREISNGQMESNTLEVGEMENNMEQEYFIILKMEAKNEENGKMEKE